MKLSLKWLKRYIPDFSANFVELDEALTQLGFEVEGIDNLGAAYENLVVGHVLSKESHPDADKLSITKLFDGQQELQVVCGAPNVAAGQKVVFAPVGTKLPLEDGKELKLKKAKIRGVESLGMICAEDEIGLGGSHAGIMELDSSYEPGTPIVDLGFYDTVIEIDVTPNRPDALNHIGVARELAAYFKLSFQEPQLELNEDSSASPISLEINIAPETFCPFYSARVIRGVQVGESPLWLKSFLNAVGTRPINNVVDVTNFVLLEYGQPLHAFDLNKFKTQQIGVRQAQPGEKLITLDGVERELIASDMVITDGDEAVCLAGVMGGASTEVDETTTDVILECAYFHTSTVRKQSRRLGLTSDSSYRFERGIDPLMQERMSDYAAALLVDICGGQVQQGRFEQSSPERVTQAIQVELRTSRVYRLLGMDLSSERIAEELSAIGIQLVSNANETQLFQIPGWRPDLTREVDLIEEVARLIGYNEIPVEYPSFVLAANPLNKFEEVSRKTRHFLSSRGLNESLSLRFDHADDFKQVFAEGDERREKVLALQNPISEDWGVMPTSQLPRMLKSVSLNSRNQEKEVRLFEVGQAFFNEPQEREKFHPGVRQDSLLSGVIAGEWPKLSYEETVSPASILDLKTILESLFTHLSLSLSFKRIEDVNFFHPMRQLGIYAGETQIGQLGEIHPHLCKTYEIKMNTIFFEMDFDWMVRKSLKQKVFQEFSKFGEMRREMSLLVEANLDQAQVLEKVQAIRTKNLKTVEFKSIYTGQGIPEGKKSLLFSCIYQSPKQTLTDEVVNKAQEKLIAHLAEDPAISFR